MVKDTLLFKRGCNELRSRGLHDSNLESSSQLPSFEPALAFLPPLLCHIECYYHSHGKLDQSFSSSGIVCNGQGLTPHRSAHSFQSVISTATLSLCCNAKFISSVLSLCILYNSHPIALSSHLLYTSFHSPILTAQFPWCSQNIGCLRSIV